MFYLMNLKGGDFMKASTKDRGMLLVIAVVILSILIGGGYLFFGLSQKAGGSIATQVRIVDKTNKELIEKIAKREESYAFKVEENESQFIELYYGEVMQGKYEIDKKSFDTLEISKYYYLDIKYNKPDVFDSGVVRKVYTENPIK